MSCRLAGLVAVLIVSASSPAADEPEFSGRKLSDWLTMLRDDALPRKRRAAVIALGQIAAERADKDTLNRVLPALAKALRSDGNAGVRTQAAGVLGRQTAEFAPLFLSDLAEVVRVEKDGEARREMALALGRLGKLSRPAVIPLIDVLKDPAAPTRAAAAEALGRIGPDARQAAPSVLPLMKDGDRNVRYAAVFALGRIDPEDPGPVSAALVATLASEAGRDGKLSALSGAASTGVWAGRRDDEMALELVLSLGLLGDRSPEVVQAVADRLSDPAAEIRRQAGLALGKFGPAARSAGEALTSVFKSDRDKLARIYALHTLRMSYGTDAKELIPVMTERLRADPEFEVRVAIAEELGSLGPSGVPAIGALREAQKDPQIKVREAAVAAVRQIQKSPSPSK
jgi:HEAT repeat protein